MHVCVGFSERADQVLDQMCGRGACGECHYCPRADRRTPLCEWGRKEPLLELAMMRRRYKDNPTCLVVCECVSSVECSAGGGLGSHFNLPFLIFEKLISLKTFLK